MDEAPVGELNRHSDTGGRRSAEPGDRPRHRPTPPRPRHEHSDPAAIVNAMTVDVEDYFHVSAFANHINPEDWDRLPSRVERNTEAVLAIFADHGVNATFFVLGWVAERYPALIRRIVAEGHELSSHGMRHIRVHHQGQTEFRADVRQTKRLLEDVGGAAVRGYRAASFSIGRETLWAFDILANEGYTYSSSIYPIHHDLYGMPEAPRFQFRPAQANGLLEVPVTTAMLFNHNLPCGGGGYFRLLPYRLSRWAMRRVNRGDRQPCVFYFHPWEIDPGQPRQSGIPLKARIRHYTNLGSMERRLRRVLSEFEWDRMDRVYLDAPAGPK